MANAGPVGGGVGGGDRRDDAAGLIVGVAAEESDGFGRGPGPEAFQDAAAALVPAPPID
ncbi:hypothetical protein [Streptomyces viridosporus]|uniref:hypothetical protein n=1 Tax=Streptomyces viridosporus TaxID=67581 RepID=UPI0036FB9F06